MAWPWTVAKRKTGFGTGIKFLAWKSTRHCSGAAGRKSPQPGLRPERNKACISLTDTALSPVMRMRGSGFKAWP